MKKKYPLLFLLFFMFYSSYNDAQVMSRVVKEYDSFSSPGTTVDSVLYFYYTPNRGDTFIGITSHIFNYDSNFSNTWGAGGGIPLPSYSLKAYDSRNNLLW